MATSAPEAREAPAPHVSLPSASRAGLSALTPMVTVEITEEEFHLTNTALVSTWPSTDRDALAHSQPLGDARWPEVDELVRAHGDDIAIPTLREAFAHAANVDHARAALSGATGAPIAFAVRAAPDLRFVRVLQAVYAAGLSGYAEPRLVLLGAETEVMLPLALPRYERPSDPDLGAHLAAALAAAGLHGQVTPAPGQPPPEALPEPAAAAGSAVAVSLRADGLHIARDGDALAPGCVEALEGDALTIPTAELAPSRLIACLDAIGTSGALTFRTSEDTRYADAVAVLETLAARGPVGLAVSR